MDTELKEETQAEETAENQQETHEEVIQTEDTTAVPTDSTDIDFKAEAERLERESGSKGKTELEKAIYTRKQIDERIKELGGEPPASDIVAPPTEGYVTKIDLARLEAKQLARSEDELKVIMWWVENKGLSVEDAHFQANKGKLKQALEELTRRATPQTGSGGGQKQPHVEVPAHPAAHMLESRGYKFNAKTKTWQARFNEEYFNPQTSQWESRKIAR